MICPNLNNPKVKSEFDELKNAVGEIAAYDIWSQNNGYSVDKTPEGESSMLFDQLLDIYGNRLDAIKAMSKIFTKSFKAKYDVANIDNLISYLKVDNSNIYEKLITDNNTITDKAIDLHDELKQSKLITPNSTLFGVTRPHLEAITDTFALQSINNAIESKTGLKKAAKYRIHNGQLTVDIDYNSIFSGKERTDDTNISTESAITIANELARKVGVKVKVVTKDKLNRLGINTDAKGVIINNTVYLVKDKFDVDVAVEEVMHPLVLKLSKDNRQLFDKLFFDAKKEFPKEWDYVKTNYTAKDGFNEHSRKLELVTKTLSKYLVNNSNNIEKADLITKFFTYIKQLLSKIFPKIAADTSSITSFKELADLINSKGTVFSVAYTSLPQFSKEDMSKLNNTYKRVMDGLNLRRKSLLSYNLKDAKRIRNLEQLVKNLDLIENKAEGIVLLIKESYNDAKDALDRINKYKSHVDLLTPDRLRQLNRDYISFYNPLFFGNNDSVSQLFKGDNKAYFDFLNDDEIDNIINMLKDLREFYADLNEEYSNLRLELVKREVKEKGVNSSTLEDALNRLEETDTDILEASVWAASAGNVNDELMRIMHYDVTNAKNEVDRKSITVSHLLANSLKNVKKESLKLLYELDEFGKRTGNFVRSLNYGRFRRNYEAFLTELAKKYNLEGIYDRPTDDNEYIEYMQERDEWLSEHAERRYTLRYYKALNKLIPAARRARDEFQTQIENILEPTRDENGKPHLEKLTESEYKLYKSLQKRKGNLANEYYDDGSPKVGEDLEIALSLKKYYDELGNNELYKINLEKFEKAKQVAKDTLSDSQYKTWIKRNTRRYIKPEFWDILDKIRNKSDKQVTERYKKLTEFRTKVLRLYRDENLIVNEDQMPDKVKKLILALDEQIQLEAKNNTYTSNETGEKFSDYATYEKTEAYYAAKDRALAQGKEAYIIWYKNNHYKDNNGVIKPASYWTYIKPIDDKFVIEEYPNSTWSEINLESEYINENYDPNLAEYGIQPKKSLYDNSKAFAEIKQNTDLYNLYTDLLSVMSQAYDKLSYRGFKDPYMMPQQTGRMWAQIRSEKNIFNGFYHFMKDNYVINDDDIDFKRDYVKAPNGETIKFIPTGYLNRLDDPSKITNDIVGSTIDFYRMATNYEEMSKISSTLELMLEQMGSRTYVKKGKGERVIDTKSGIETNVYKKAEKFLNNQIYGTHEIPLTIGKFSVGKMWNDLINYVRKTNLFSNVWAILAGLFTSKSYSRIEAILGRYYDNDNLLSADKELITQLPKITAGIGNPIPNTKILALLELNGVSQVAEENYKRLNQTRCIRFLNQHFWYGGYSLADFLVKSKIVTAIYFNYKFIPEAGKFMSKDKFINTYYQNDNKAGKLAWKAYNETLYNAYDFSNGELKIKDKYKKYIDSNFLNLVRNTSRTVSARIDGVINETDKTALHASLFGKAFLIHRNWMLDGIQNRFKHRMYNYLTDTIEEGYYRSFGRYIANSFKMMKSKSSLNMLKIFLSQYQSLTAQEKYNIKKVLLELVYGNLILLPLAVLTRLAADDEPDNWEKNATAYMVARIRFEMMAFYGMGEIISLLNSPTAATSIVENSQAVITLLLPNMQWFNDDDYGQTLVNKATKITPVKGILGIQYPRQKMLYMEKEMMWSGFLNPDNITKYIENY